MGCEMVGACRMPERYDKQNFSRKSYREDRIGKTCGRIYKGPIFLRLYSYNCSTFVLGKVGSDC
jgi:hypothetical protein